MIVTPKNPYYGYDTQIGVTVLLYRFDNESLDTHFHTSSTQEKNFFLKSPDYESEGGGDGIAFYLLVYTSVEMVDLLKNLEAKVAVGGIRDV